MIAAIAASVSAYAVSSTRLASGTSLRACDEVLGARHARHPLVGDQQRDLVAARAQLAQQLERLGARGRPQDPVALAEAAAQVARDGGQHRGLVVDGDDRGTALGRRPRLLRGGEPRHERAR